MAGYFMGVSAHSKLSELRDVLSGVADKEDFRARTERAVAEMFPHDLVPRAFMLHAYLFMALGKEEYENTYNFHRSEYINNGRNGRPTAISFNRAEQELMNAHDKDYTLDDILEKLNNDDDEFRAFIDLFDLVGVNYISYCRDKVNKYGQSRENVMADMRDGREAMVYFKSLMDYEFMCDDAEIKAICGGRG